MPLFTIDHLFLLNAIHTTKKAIENKYHLHLNIVFVNIPLLFHNTLFIEETVIN